MYLVMLIVAIVAIAVPVIAYTSNAPVRAVAAKEKIKEANRRELESRAEARISIRALRSIANGAGNPALEAQLALEEIDNNQNREITQ